MPIRMKLGPKEKQITRNMAPGVYCRDGFLGNDSRPLSVILDTDRSSLADLEVTHEQIADALQDVLTKAIDSYGAPVDAGVALA